MSLIQLAENRWLPDSLVRFGVRRLLRERLTTEAQLTHGDFNAALDRFADRLRDSMVTIETHRANEQHYEVPAAFFELVLGSRLKYSCGLWAAETRSLDDAEQAMLRLTCERAEITDGMRILDLGCGWGSLTLWIAEHYPHCQILALSNSHSQRLFIEKRCRELGFRNVHVQTADVGQFQTQQQFDRVVSVEMFEHVRNHERLLANIKNWLTPQGQLFVHIFCHRKLAYTFETEGENNWMGRHFFSGGIMPAEKLFFRFQRDLAVKDHWWIDGNHYARTCEAWLENLDARRAQVEQALANVKTNDMPGSKRSRRRLVQRWRMFFIACAELFQFNDGQEWGVGHYVFHRQ